MRVRKAQSASKVYKNIDNLLGLRHGTAAQVIQLFCEDAIRHLDTGGTIRLPGIGSIGTKERKARWIAKRTTGERVFSPSGRILRFTKKEYSRVTYQE